MVIPLSLLRVTFQSSLPHGSDLLSTNIINTDYIKFQSSLPHGSDIQRKRTGNVERYFNPRSLTGATFAFTVLWCTDMYFNPRSLTGATNFVMINFVNHFNFNPRSLTGATVFGGDTGGSSGDFNPRSLTGATFNANDTNSTANISILAPSRERQHQNKLLLYSFKSSIFCELAQLKYSKIYFDVRKLIVSHSSLSCEPKLNFMFHITSHHEPKLHKH